MLFRSFETIWPLQGAYATCPRGEPRYRPLSEMKPAEKAMMQAVLDGFVAFKPPLVVVDRVAGIPRCGGVDFDLLAYFAREPRFAAAMANYELLREFDRYLIFKRRDATPEGAGALPPVRQ